MSNNLPDPIDYAGLYFVLRDGKPAEVLHRTGDALGLWQSAWTLARSKPGGTVAIAAFDNPHGPVKVWTDDTDFEHCVLKPIWEVFPPPPRTPEEERTLRDTEAIAERVFERLAARRDDSYVACASHAFDAAKAFIDERERRREQKEPT